MNSLTLQRLSDTHPASHGYDCIVDVRSPAEFADDHLPGAINLPVLDDAERAHVGTVYKQQSPFLARKIGAALVARNVARHLETALAQCEKSWSPLVYVSHFPQWFFVTSCAGIAGEAGSARPRLRPSSLRLDGEWVSCTWRALPAVNNCDNLSRSGGYKAYRHLVTHTLHALPVTQRLILLDGNTGTAKTAVLAKLAAAGAQVVDLEALACHRGSVFGHSSLLQPSQRLFESVLARTLSSADPSRPLILEAESSRIGALRLPAPLVAAMRSGACSCSAIPLCRTES